MDSHKKVEMIESREWYLASYAPEGVPTSDHLKLRTFSISLAELPDRHVVVETLYISIDPYLRAMMTGIDDGLYLPQIQINQVIKSFGFARVIQSKESNYSEGDVVLSPFLPVAEYSVVQPSHLRFQKIDPASGISFIDYLCTCGPAGFAAWVAIEVIGNPKQGSNVFISAAAGGVGMHAGQLAKLKGCNVIGSTGSDEKVRPFSCPPLQGHCPGALPVSDLMNLSQKFLDGPNCQSTDGPCGSICVGRPVQRNNNLTKLQKPVFVRFEKQKVEITSELLREKIT